MKVFEKGVGQVNLNKNDFVASGGEGSVYAKGSTAYKIYTESHKMIPVAKIKELSQISNSKVIRPLNVLLNDKNREVGYTMRYLQDTHALCQIFTKSFKDRHSISPDKILHLVRDMQRTVKHIHDSGVLVVDLNEMNFLVDKSFNEVYFIDVDSYQTPSFPATAIMESIRDRHATTFTQGSDWFSFAVVSFQLFMGIHPYKGKHKTNKGYSFDDRMKDNISVFNAQIKIPKICPSFDLIPKVYRDWYFKVFEEGYREAPPFDLNAKIEVVFNVNKVKGNDKFVIKEVKEFEDEVAIYLEADNSYLVKTKDGKVYHDHILYNSSNEACYSFTPRHNQTIETHIDENGLLHHFNLNIKKPVTVGNGITKASSIMSYGGRLYAQSESNILEMQFSGSQDMIASPKIVGHVLEKASKMYDGVVIQNLMGFYYASVFPEAGKCYQVILEELTDYKIVEAKFDNRILMVIGNKDGQYDKFIYRLDREYKITDLRKEDNIAILNLNFVCLPNGIVAHINDRENLELFPVKGSDIKEIDSDVISSDVKLHKFGTYVYFSKGNTLYWMRTK